MDQKRDELVMKLRSKKLQRPARIGTEQGLGPPEPPGCFSGPGGSAERDSVNLAPPRYYQNVVKIGNKGGLQIVAPPAGLECLGATFEKAHNRINDVVIVD